MGQSSLSSTTRPALLEISPESATIELMRQDAAHPEMPTAEKVLPARTNIEAIELLRKWLADESGYDEETWPELKKGIEENRLSSRPRFRD